jgi:Flp pilus assembly protein TadG
MKATMLRVNDTNSSRSSIHRSVRSGQTTVEFALILIVLLALLYGILEVSRMVFINSEVGNAAREAAQYVSLHATEPGVVADATAKARAKITWADPTQLQISIPSFTPCSFCQVTVTATYSWHSVVNFVPDVQHFTLRPLGPISLTSTSTRLIENGSN